MRIGSHNLPPGPGIEPADGVGGDDRGQETLYVWGLSLFTQVNPDGTRQYIKSMPSAVPS